jgi:hypothetical protein
MQYSQRPDEFMTCSLVQFIMSILRNISFRPIGIGSEFANVTVMLMNTDELGRLCTIILGTYTTPLFTLKLITEKVVPFSNMHLGI